MSGIFGYVGTENAKELLLDGLNSLKHRGQDSCGFALRINEDILQIKSVGELGSLINKSASVKCESNLGLAQCDMTFRSKPTPITAKPSANNLYAVAMDGIIENFDELKRKTGNPFLISSDEDLILAMLCVMNEQSHLVATQRVAELINGAPSFVFFANDEEAIYCSAGSNPLVVASSSKGFFVASEINSLAPFCNKYLVLEKGEFAKITRDKLVLCDKKLRKIKKPFSTLNVDLSNDDMLFIDELLYLPSIVRDELNALVKNYKLNFDELKINRRTVDKIKRIVLIGQGSSLNSARLVSHFFEQMTDIPCIAYDSSELLCSKTIIDKDTLLIAVSHSGESIFTIKACMRAMAFGAKSIAVTGNKNSYLARVCNEIVFTKCTLYTSSIFSFASSYIALTMLCMYIGKKSGVVNDLYLNVNLKMSEMLPGKISSSIKNTSSLEGIANAIYGISNIYVSGLGSDYSLAREVADNFSRYADMNARAFPLSELALNDAVRLKGNVVFALITNDDISQNALSYFRRVRSMGAKVLIFTTESISETIADFDNIVSFNDSLPLFNPLICICGLNKLSSIIADKKNDEKQQQAG